MEDKWFLGLNGVFFVLNTLIAIHWARNKKVLWLTISVVGATASFLALIARLLGGN